MTNHPNSIIFCWRALAHGCALMTESVVPFPAPDEERARRLPASPAKEGRRALLARREKTP